MRDARKRTRTAGGRAPLPMAAVLLATGLAVLCCASGCGRRTPDGHGSSSGIRTGSISVPCCSGRSTGSWRLHPEVKVEQLFKETEELRSGFIIAALAGQGPDIVYGPSDQVGPFEVMQIIQPLETIFERDWLRTVRSPGHDLVQGAPLPGGRQAGQSPDPGLQQEAGARSPHHGARNCGDRQVGDGGSERGRQDRTGTA